MSFTLQTFIFLFFYFLTVRAGDSPPIVEFNCSSQLLIHSTERNSIVSQSSRVKSKLFYGSYYSIITKECKR